MKKILLLLLFSSIICLDSSPLNKILEIIKCLANSNIFNESLKEIIEAFNSNDPNIIIKTGITLFYEFKKEISKCNNKLRRLNNDDNDEDIKLGYPKEVYVLFTQIGNRAFEWYDSGGLAALRDNCFTYYAQAWFCQYLNK